MKKAVLIGDSIRRSYQPHVAKMLEGEIEILGSTANGRHTMWGIDHIEEWVLEHKPDLVHFNFGIHDLRFFEGDQPRTLLDQYRLNLKRFIRILKKASINKIIWATTTPLYEPDKNKAMSEWNKTSWPLEQYNAAALEIVKTEGLLVNDLNQVIMKNDWLKCIRLDGCHLEEFGQIKTAEAVADAIRRYI